MQQGATYHSVDHGLDVASASHDLPLTFSMQIELQIRLERRTDYLELYVYSSKSEEVPIRKLSS